MDIDIDGGFRVECSQYMCVCCVVTVDKIDELLFYDAVVVFRCSDGNGRVCACVVFLSCGEECF